MNILKYLAATPHYIEAALTETLRLEAGNVVVPCRNSSGYSDCIVLGALLFFHLVWQAICLQPILEFNA